ncbi:MAG: GTPase ObgE [Phycisphaerae bacterium]
MIFVDEAEIFVRGGRGGDGAVSFRRELAVPKGGPDGGDGGDGGSVIIEAADDVDTLAELAHRHHWHADSGRPGSGANKAGKSAHDLHIRVPPGTLVHDAVTGLLLKDLTNTGQRVTVGHGGRGGHGNARFATATHQTPREFEPGAPGEERRIRLVLKLIADVGIVGLPNAGKSTLLSRLSRARPKIADYPFTTLIPQLGTVDLPGFRRFILADIPGLIEGAHAGAGLGDQFLRHIERTRMIVHLVDLFPLEGQPTALAAYRTVRAELAQFNPALAAKPELIVLNKLDLGAGDDERRAFEAAVGQSCVAISAVTGRGLTDLTNAIWRALEAERGAHR